MIRVEHVGSTSVPRLAAKPVIRIVFTVADSSAEETYLPSLRLPATACSSGSRSGTNIGSRKPNPAIQIHVFTEGSAEVERMLLFRDRLRGSREATTGSRIGF